jgi:hypothetical protein
MATSPAPSALELVPGTHVSMAPPDGFTPSASFTGFEHSCGASIVVAELPASYLSLVGELTDAALKTQGIAVRARSDETVDGRQGTLIIGLQEGGGIQFTKIFVITGSDRLTAMVTGNLPASLCRPEAETAMRDAELGMAFDPDAAPDPQAGLFFSLTPTPPLLFAGTISGGGIYNTSGLVPSADKDEPSLIVASSLGAPAGPNLESTLAMGLKGLATVSGVVIDSIESRTVAGLPGAVAVGSGQRTSTSTPLFIYAVLLDEGSLGYVLLLGTCPADLAGEWEDRFEASTETYRRKR